MFHTLAYAGAVTAANTNTQLSAISDSEFTNQGSTPAFVLSEDYDLILAAGFGTTATDQRFDMPSINQIARHHIWPLNQTLVSQTTPRVQDLRNYPLRLPTFEQLILQASNSGGTAEVTTTFLWLAPPSFNRNLPRGQRRLTIAATGAVAGVAGAWSGLGNITFAENLRSGWYSLVGAQVFDAGTLALRFVFPRPFMHQGRKLRPGILASESIAFLPYPDFMGGLGEFGRFHSQEPPQIEIYANATASSVQVMRLDIVYLGEGSPQNSGM